MQNFEAMAKNEEEKAMQALVSGGDIEVEEEYWNTFGKILSKKIESQTVRLTELRLIYASASGLDTAFRGADALKEQDCSGCCFFHVNFQVSQCI